MSESVSTTHIESDHEYSQLERLIAERIASVEGPLFTTNAEVWDTYLDGIPAQFRQHYTCRCCRRFVEAYSGLVTIDLGGGIHPFIWDGFRSDDFPTFFGQAAMNACQRVLHAKVTGVFINGDAQWGTPFNVPGPGSKYQGQRWTHLHGSPKSVYSSPIKTAFQLSAEKREDYITLKKSMADFPMEAVVQAVRVLEADAVDRSEKTLGVAKWLLDLHGKVEGKRGSTRDNLIWFAVATAAPGWCHIRSTMIGTLMEDVIRGLPFDDIKGRWDAKMHPLKYQRPTTVKEGNIERANTIVAKLQSEGALARRFAKLEDVVSIWKPTPKTKEPDKSKSGGGAFDHLKARSSRRIQPVELPAKKVGWSTFANSLASIRQLEVYLGHGALPIFGMVTAVDPHSVPLLQWDTDPRNPFSWYFYHGGSSAVNWGLEVGWTEVDAVCLKPCNWYREYFHQGGGIFFVLSGAKDLRRDKGAGFFPETLRSEYHEIRHAMEAYARDAIVEGRDEGTANGIALGERTPLRLRSEAGEEWEVSL